jgi:hypothetical protein
LLQTNVVPGQYAPAAIISVRDTFNYVDHKRLKNNKKYAGMGNMS